MSLKKVQEFLKVDGMDKKIVVHKVIIDTVEHAAEAIGCKPQEICKTMSFLVNDEPIVICMAGDAKVSNSKFKEYFHEKARMIPWDKVEEYTGHEPGGVTPFACNDNVKVYLDESLKRFEIVYAAAGSHDSSIGVTIPELEKYTNYIAWVNVSNIIE